MRLGIFKNRFLKLGLFAVTGGLCLLFSAASPPVDITTATIQANRINGSVAGGAIPYTDPVFVQMVADIQAGSPQQAVADAINSKYFPYYLPRRMAKQMMNAAMSEGGIPDNDGVVFIVANLLGLGGTQPSISSIWSDNATYCVNSSYNALAGYSQAIGEGPCAPNMGRMLAIPDPMGVDWTTGLVKVNKQMIEGVQVQAKDVGGYMTLSDMSGLGDLASTYNNFASFAFFGGTNLRGIEYVYQIGLGASLASMQGTANVTPDMTPKFIPSTNPNFLVGNNQPACIACHGGGATNRLHGYAVFADKFNFVSNGGMSYTPNPGYRVGTDDLGKSYGSNEDQGARFLVATCDQRNNPDIACNPASPGVSQTQDWDLTYWKNSGLLTKWGWNGPIKGSGLNALAVAVGQANQTYQFMTQRVINEICPTGSFTQTTINNIAAGAMNQEAIVKASVNHVAADKGPFGYIVIQVASDPSCL